VKMNLSKAVEFYLETRRSFGFALSQVEVELHSLVRYAQEVGHTGPLTSSLIVNWAKKPQQCAPSYHAVRLEIGRRFAQFWLSYEPRTEVPPLGRLGPLYARRAVHIYTPEEVGALMHAASELGSIHPLRRATFCTVVGLLDCTGLRISEALGLHEQDIDWSAGVLTIRDTKGGHSRLVPVHASTLEGLERYRRLRKKALPSGSTSRLFVSWHGCALGYDGIQAPFRRLCCKLGWTRPPIPRLHDFRHTFAVRTLLRWYRKGQSPASQLWTLSTYLGHRHLADTYWYLTAVPELMQLCHERFAHAQSWASGGITHV
jgi:integrase